MLELKLPDLPYPANALEPHMSAETFSYHYERHHNNYVINGNKLIQVAGFSQPHTVEDAVRKSYVDSSKAAIFNNVAQHWNHVHFWNWMKPDGGGEPTGDMGKRIKDNFGSFKAFRTEFVNAGFTRFGSGWVWLTVGGSSGAGGKLRIVSTPNGENPLTQNLWPILGCDVWEHSYYIDYRHDRRTYLETFIDHLVNWEYVGRMLERDNVIF